MMSAFLQQKQKKKFFLSKAFCFPSYVTLDAIMYD